MGPPSRCHARVVRSLGRWSGGLKQTEVRIIFHGMGMAWHGNPSNVGPAKSRASKLKKILVLLT